MRRVSSSFQGSRVPKRLIERFLPDHVAIRKHKQLKFLGDRLHDPNLWHLNRRSVAGAMGAGVFLAFVPLPMQMLMAAAAAIWLRINLPIAVAMVWITNPVTMAPIFFFTYKVGTWLLGMQPQKFKFEPTLDWFMTKAGAIGCPLLTGSLIVGAVLGLLVYGAVRLAWRIYVIRRRHKNAASG